MKIYLYYIGKPRDRHAGAIAEEYVKRLGRYARCEMREIRPTRFDPFARHAEALTVLLDPKGRRMDSESFTAFLGKAEQEARDVVFVVGGADGLPPGWQQRAGMLLSLSEMTFPHELARVILAEQVYRALTILRGHPYALGH